MLIDELLASPALAQTRWSIDIRRGREVLFAHDAFAPLKTASVAKLFVLYELARRIEAGDVNVGDRVAKSSIAPVADSGLWQHLDTETLTLIDAARLVGSVSDNLATNVLIKHLGLANIQETATSLVSEQTRLLDIVRDERTHEHAPTLSLGTARDWADFLSRLIDDPTDPIHRRVLESISTSVDHSMVAAAFDLDPLAHSHEPGAGLALLNKTGTDEGVRTDVGIVRLAGESIVYAVICNWPAENPELRHDVLRTMCAIGEFIKLAT